MASFSGPSIVNSGLIFEYDMADYRNSYFGGPATNAMYTTYGAEVAPWSVGPGGSTGNNTDVTNTDIGKNAPVPSAKTWKFIKTGAAYTWDGTAHDANQWNGWEGGYGNIWTGNSGDYWTTSYWYKTSAPAGINGFSVGAFYTSNWSRAYNTTIMDNVSTIIADGQWHFNYTVTRLNENYSSAITADGPSWNYSTYPGELYINGVQWTKTAYPTQFVWGTRSNTQVLKDRIGNKTITASSLTYNTDGSFSFDGTNNYLSVGDINDSIFNSGSWTISAWVKFTSVGRLYDNAIFGHGSIGTNTALHLAERGGYAYFGLYANDLAGTIPISAGVWTHITFTYNYTTKLKTIYINGVYDNSGGTVGYSGTGSNPSVGTYLWATNNKMYGSIPMVQIYNRALSASEVQQNFNALRGRFGI